MIQRNQIKNQTCDQLNLNHGSLIWMALVDIIMIITLHEILMGLLVFWVQLRFEKYKNTAAEKTTTRCVVLRYKRLPLNKL